MKRNFPAFPLLIGVVMFLFMAFPQLLEDQPYEKPVLPILATSTPTTEATIDPLLIAAIQRSESAPTQTSWIVPGGFGFMPLNMGSVPEGTYESISFYLGVDGQNSHEWVSVRADSENVAGQGATFRSIYTYTDEETYMATVVFKGDGTQMVYVLDQDGKVFDSFEVSVSEYGTISELGSLTVASEKIDAQGTVATVAKVLVVTDTGHWYRHWPSDGSPSPVLDNLLP